MKVDMNLNDNSDEKYYNTVVIEDSGHKYLSQADSEDKFIFIRRVYLFLILQNVITTLFTCITLIPRVEYVVEYNFVIVILGVLLFCTLQTVNYCFQNFFKILPWNILTYIGTMISLELILLWISAYFEPAVIICWTLDILITLGLLIGITYLFKNESNAWRLFISILVTCAITVLLIISFRFAFRGSFIAVILMGMFMLVANCYLSFSTYLMLEINGDSFTLDDYFWASICMYHYLINIMIFFINLCKISSANRNNRDNSSGSAPNADNNVNVNMSVDVDVDVTTKKEDDVETKLVQ